MEKFVIKERKCQKNKSIRTLLDYLRVFFFSINFRFVFFSRFPMGIHNLAKLIADYAPAAIKEGEMANYFGRKIAIDA